MPLKNRFSNALNRATRKIKNAPRYLQAKLKGKPFHPTMATRADEMKALASFETKQLNRMTKQFRAKRFNVNLMMKETPPLFEQVNAAISELQSILASIEGKGVDEGLRILISQKYLIDETYKKGEEVLLELTKQLRTVYEAADELDKNTLTPKNAMNTNSVKKLVGDSLHGLREVARLQEEMSSLLGEFNQQIDVLQKLRGRPLTPQDKYEQAANVVSMRNISNEEANLLMKGPPSPPSTRSERVKWLRTGKRGGKQTRRNRKH